MSSRTIGTSSTGTSIMVCVVASRRFVLGNRLHVGLRLVVLENAPNALLVPASGIL